MGLSALLESSKEQPRVSTPAEPPEKVQEATSPKVEEEPLSEFEVFANAGDWRALGQRCDKLLPPQVSADERLELLETRFWWARSQQRLAAVPLSLLASPLEDLARKLLQALEVVAKPVPGTRLYRLKAEAAVTLGEVAKELAKQGEKELGARLEQLKAAFEGREGDLVPKEPSPPQLPESSQARTAEVPEVQERRAAKRGMDSRERLRSGFEPAAQDSRESASAPSTSRRFVFWALAGVALACFLLLRAPGEEGASSQSLGQSFFGGAFFGGGEVGARSSLPLRDGISPPELRAPEAKLVSGVNQLDSILEDIKNDRSQLADLKTRPPGPGTQSVAAQVPPAQVSAPQAPLASAASSEGRLGTNGKEKIDMSGPREPANFPRGEESSRRRDERGGSPGSPQRAEDTRRSSPGTAERPGFEDFRKPRTYRTLIETDVMSDPTIRGRVLDTLPARVEVLVEGREGYWLRVRSQKGNVGYILAQDAQRQD